MVVPTQAEALAALETLQAWTESQPSGPVYHDDSVYLFGRTPTALSTDYKTAIDAFIVGCDADGVWGPWKFLNVVLNTVDNTRINLRPFPAFDFAKEGSSFTIDPGVSMSAGPTSRLQSAYFVPGSEKDNCLIMVDSLFTGGISAFAMGNGSHGIYPRNSSNQSFKRVSATSSVVVSGVGTSAGTLMLSRGNSANFDDSVGGTTVNRTKASVTPSSVGFSMFGNAETGHYWPNAGAFAWGAATYMDATKRGLFLARLATLKTALAAAAE